MREKPIITYSKEPVLEPKEGCAWADTMVLNPALVLDEDGKTIHMLFRATGPWPEANLKGKSDPYPIFLGYAKSTDMGESFTADFERPALAPKLAYDEQDMYVINDKGEKVINYANGCIEDPRLFYIGAQLYLTVACRLFPPGPYWEGDKRKDNLPDWVMDPDSPVGVLARRNDTVTVLYKVNLNKLKEGKYEEAFSYVGPLTDGNLSDNRDVFFFPKRMNVGGAQRLVMLHRPERSYEFPTGEGVMTPAIFLSAADEFEDFATKSATHRLLAKSEFDWEQERVGASFPPIDIGDGEWLVSYHGKELPNYGYTQSFMILKERDGDFPEIKHRMSERLIYARQKWELPDKFPCPCIFTTGAVTIGDELIMGYGAADQKIGIAKVNLKDLVDYVRGFDEDGNRTD
ncbi:hypothetical protein [Butyrivibrio sp. VCB2001]|uniref:glycoside hydrolase family 130 protein n=1 Tax=Butyrivibrio sp. VCB2001 TaxID=1280667 RepID=UPI00042228AC|nr:hypothetical protein [Butyrivibrio sp. VCB2001]